MSDLNYLMCKAIDNPGLTTSSSLRTAFISVFEDSIIDDSNEMHQELGLEDYVGCSSVHGVGPSIAIFDTIRNGQLDCACVYPSPLHSREQMEELIGHMKRMLVDDCNN
ncbi:GATA zinc finger protein [Quillaja saponaria]|uniref:GATA zinc finger protein n=1 Tax=Quillaja saponaria TaxID=32244 RepID=A0AAD7Q775_QUISA|nr:GATA zinc finger protein [Quillaja saponaria]